MCLHLGTRKLGWKDMSSKVKVELNKSGIIELLKSTEVATETMSHVNGALAQLGNGYAGELREKSDRKVGVIYPDGTRRVDDNYTNKMKKAVFSS